MVRYGATRIFGGAALLKFPATVHANTSIARTGLLCGIGQSAHGTFSLVVIGPNLAEPGDGAANLLLGLSAIPDACCAGYPATAHITLWYAALTAIGLRLKGL